MRRGVNKILNANTSRKYIPYQDLENKKMLLDVLNEPQSFVSHVRRYTNSITTQMVFGFRTDDPNHPRVRQMFEGLRDFSKMADSAVASLLDGFPWLRHLPDFLIPAIKHARGIHLEEKAFYETSWIETKKEIESDVARVSQPSA